MNILADASNFIITPGSIVIVNPSPTVTVPVAVKGLCSIVRWISYYKIFNITINIL
jgi:hypothetical protein